MNNSKHLYKALNHAYNYFNKGLFNNELPEVIITLSRAKRAHGFAAKQLWTNENDKDNKRYHELAISPKGLLRPLIDVYSTLVHEQCHIWQFEFGKPGNRGYHNLEWVRIMEKVGLTPSQTGKEGGEKTGRPMSHYITPNGKFEKLFKKLPKRCILPVVSIEGKYVPNSSRNKVKYSCISCSFSVWGKSGLPLICGYCKKELTENPEIDFRY